MFEYSEPSSVTLSVEELGHGVDSYSTRFDRVDVEEVGGLPSVKERIAVESVEYGSDRLLGSVLPSSNRTSYSQLSQTLRPRE